MPIQFPGNSLFHGSAAQHLFLSKDESHNIDKILRDFVHDDTIKAMGSRATFPLDPNSNPILFNAIDQAVLTIMRHQRPSGGNYTFDEAAAYLSNLGVPLVMVNGERTIGGVGTESRYRDLIYDNTPAYDPSQFGNGED